MKRRRITLADGRYLIFYTFDDETPGRTPLDAGGAEERGREPEREAERGEEQPHV